MQATKRMAAKRMRGWWVALATGLALTTVALLAHAGGGKPESKLVNVADTRLLEAGLTKFVGDVYNQSMVLYGLLVVGVMVTMGAVLGLLFDRGMVLLGINLGKLDHHE